MNITNIRTETWCGYEIRFVEINGEWYAVLKDICDALDLKTYKVVQRLDARLIEKCDIPSKDATFKARKYQRMSVINEVGVYETLFASKKPEAKKFRLWTGEVLQKLRGFVGLQGYEVMRMTDEDIQSQINDILEAMYWDEERKELMVSVTVAGGDVDQIPFSTYISKGEK